jgi:hypothetical protein
MRCSGFVARGAPLLALALGALLGAPTVWAGAPSHAPAQGAVGEHAPGSVVNSFVAFWNNQDVTGVLTTITPDVVVRQRRAETTPRATSVEVADVLGRRSVLTDPSRLAADGTIMWARGWQELAEWAKDLFQDEHRLEVGAPQESGDVVRVAYSARVNPYRQIAGVEPGQGVLEATVRGGKIAVLVLESGGDAAARRDAAMTHAVLDAQSRAGARWAEAHPDGHMADGVVGGRDTQSRGVPLAARLALPAALGLVVAGALAAFRSPVSAR